MHTWIIYSMSGSLLGYINAASYSDAIVYAMMEWPDTRGHDVRMS